MAKAYCTVRLRALAYVEKEVTVEVEYNPEEHVDDDIENMAENIALTTDDSDWEVSDLMDREVSSISIDYKHMGGKCYLMKIQTF